MPKKKKHSPKVAILAEPGTPEWVEQRKKFIGASESAAACGQSPWESEFGLYSRKTGLIPDKAVTLAMRIGTLVESEIIAEYERITGRQVKTGIATLQHPDHEWMTATPDGIAQCKPERLVECKTTTYRAQLGREGTDEVPVTWLIQAQQQMAVTGLDMCDIAVAVDNQAVGIYPVHRNDELIRQIIRRAGEMARRIRELDPPQPNWSHPQTPELLGKLFEKKTAGASVTLDEETANYWDKYKRCTAQITALEKLRSEYKAHVIYAMGNCEKAFFPNGVDKELEVKHVTRKGYEVDDSEYTTLTERKRDGT